MQSVNESTYDFVVRLMSNREKVIVLVIVLSIMSILVIKQAVSHSHASGFEQTLTNEIFSDARTVPLLNQNVLIVLLVDLKIIESLSVRIKIKKRSCSKETRRN